MIFKKKLSWLRRFVRLLGVMLVSDPDRPSERRRKPLRNGVKLKLIGPPPKHAPRLSVMPVEPARSAKPTRLRNAPKVHRDCRGTGWGPNFDTCLLLLSLLFTTLAVLW